MSVNPGERLLTQEIELGELRTTTEQFTIKDVKESMVESVPVRFYEIDYVSLENGLKGIVRYSSRGTNDVRQFRRANGNAHGTERDSRKILTLLSISSQGFWSISIRSWVTMMV